MTGFRVSNREVRPPPETPVDIEIGDVSNEVASIRLITNYWSQITWAFEHFVRGGRHLVNMVTRWLRHLVTS